MTITTTTGLLLLARLTLLERLLLLSYGFYNFHYYCALRLAMRDLL